MTFSSDENSKRRHKPGKFESNKFEFRRSSYISYLKTVKTMGYSFEDLLHYFPCFVGEMTLSRVLALYEGYKIVNGVCGHIADVGMFKGSSSFLFSKLVNIFEPNSLVQVHGFDWFEGNQPDLWEKNIIPSGGKESYSRVKKLNEIQSLSNILNIHKIDLTKDLSSFFEENTHLRFKLVFMDAGMYSVVKNALPFFWDRLTKGGIIIFDQYNFDASPGETKAVSEVLNDFECEIKSFPFTWMPTAYIKK